MTAWYHVLCSDELMDGKFGELLWPACLRPVERGEADGPYAHWWLFEDDEADEALNGKCVDLVMRMAALGQPAEIIERRPA